MLRIDELMAVLAPEDQALVAFDVYRTYGKHLTKHVQKHVNGHLVATMFPVTAGAMGVQQGSSPKGKNLELQGKAIDVLNFLNQKTGKSFRPVEENLRFIRARLAKASVEDCKGVIARKTRAWLNTEQGVWLRPKTLFNATNFEQYLGERDA